MTISPGEWLVPFTGRNASGIYNQNFLWRSQSIYVMDNHRAAMWCWLQHVNPRQLHSLLHIDRHYDCLDSRMDEWLENCPDDLARLSINEYLRCDYAFNDFGRSQRIQLIRWDNYLSIYLVRYGNSIRRLQMCTHDDGQEPHQDFVRGDLWDIPYDIDDWLASDYGPWIFNLDLDYFFRHHEEQPGLRVSNTYLTTCFEKVREKIRDGTIAVTTVALSPEESFTGGWEPAERLAERVLQILGINFALPK